jgi:hypothetical protein
MSWSRDQIRLRIDPDAPGHGPGARSTSARTRHSPTYTREKTAVDVDRYRRRVLRALIEILAPFSIPLEQEGDHARWGPGIGHSWRAGEHSVDVT